MARVLITGDAERGAVLGAALVAGGHAVRLLTDGRAVDGAVAPPGVEVVAAEGAWLGAVVSRLDGVAILCRLWERGDDLATHVERLDALLARVVDTGVRGVVYEPPDDPATAAAGIATLERAAATWSIPVVTLAAGLADAEAWSRAAVAAVDGLLGPR